MKDRGNLGSIAKVRRYPVLQNFRTGCGVHVTSSLEDATVKTAAACHLPLSTTNAKNKIAPTFVFTLPPYAVVWCVRTT